MLDPFATAFATHDVARRALVVGGGIGGLAAAIGLRRAGWHVAVAEREAVLREVGAGLGLWANGLAALRWLGVADRVAPALMPDRGGAVRLPDGTLLADAPNAPTGDLAHAVHRADLHAALLATLGPSRVVLGACLAAFEDDGTVVRAHFEDGTHVDAAMLVGADGIHSVVRTRLHGDAPLRYAGYTAWRGVTPFAPNDVRNGEAWGAGRRFGMAALAHDRVYWYAAMDAPPGARSADGERALLLRTFGDWQRPIRALIECTDESAILRNDVVDRAPLGHWGRGRVTLLGDAAHPMTPNLGQGACQALEDAVALAIACAGAPNVSDALCGYERRRRPRANRFVRRSRAAGQVAQLQHPLAIALRSTLIRRLTPRLTPMLVADILAHGIPA